MMTEEWEEIGKGLWRIKIYGGWLVEDRDEGKFALCFIPDLKHKWKLKDEKRKEEWNLTKLSAGTVYL